MTEAPCASAREPLICVNLEPLFKSRVMAADATPIDVPQDHVRVTSMYVVLDNEQQQQQQPRPRPRPRRSPPQQPRPPPPVTPQEPDRHRCPRRVGYCCLVVPFFFAFCVSAMSVITLAIKNEQVKEKCEEIPCLLGCDSTKHPQVNCWIAFGGGGVVCVVAVLFILSLVIRMCFGSKL